MFYILILFLFVLVQMFQFYILNQAVLSLGDMRVCMCMEVHGCVCIVYCSACMCMRVCIIACSACMCAHQPDTRADLTKHLSRQIPSFSHPRVPMKPNQTPVLWREPKDRHSSMSKSRRQIHLSIHLSVHLVWQQSIPVFCFHLLQDPFFLYR